MRLTIIGGSLTGNKGAASMVLGLLDEFTEDAVVVLTPSLERDRASGIAEDRPLLDYGPVNILLACLVAPFARLTRGTLTTPALRALSEADCVADVSGISFVDGRGLLTLAYNVLLVLPALLLGTPVVKVAQAMGPFDQTSTAVAARAVLPAITTVLARGDRTVEHLEDAGLHHDGLAADVAFLMHVRDADHSWAAEITADEDRPLVVVCPSQVVVGQASDGGQAYTKTMGAVIDALSEDARVLLVAHSSRPGEPAGRLNDLPLCEQLAAGAAHPEAVSVVPDADPRQLRALMQRCDVVVASRFHAMVSALATATPVFVVGWSHKYAEVLRAFGHEELTVDHGDVTVDELVDRVASLRQDRDAVASDLSTALPDVVSAARRNVEAVRAAARLH